MDNTFDNYVYYNCKEGEDPLKVRSFMTYVVKLDENGNKYVLANSPFSLKFIFDQWF